MDMWQAALGGDRPAAMEKGMVGFALAEYHAVTRHFITDGQAHPVIGTDPGPDIQRIIIAGTLQIITAHANHRADRATFLQIAVGQAYGAQIIRAGHFKPANIIGVVDDAHGVCFIIANAHRNTVSRP